MKKYLLYLATIALAALAAFAVTTTVFAASTAWTGTAVLTQATDNQTTAAVALPNQSVSMGGAVRTLWVANETAITSSTMQIRCSPDGGTTYYPFYTFDNGTNIVAGTTAAAVTVVMFQVPGDVSVCTHVKVYFGTAQAADENVFLYGR